MIITPKPTLSLRLHPILESQPGWADDEKSFDAFCEDVRVRGIKDPIHITPDGQIIDGRHRWRAAKRVGVESIPCIVEAHEDEIPLIIAGSLHHRRHYTKSQLAYMIYPVLKEILVRATNKKLSNLKNQSISIHAEQNQHATIEDLARALDVSRDLLLQSIKIHEMFAVNPDWKAMDEPKIMSQSDPMGLGAVIAGFAGRAATKGKERPELTETRQMVLFNQPFKDMGNRFEYWTSFTPEQKRAVISRIDTTIEKMPDDLLNEWHRKASQELKRRNSENK